MVRGYLGLFHRSRDLRRYVVILGLSCRQCPSIPESAGVLRQLWSEVQQAGASRASDGHDRDLATDMKLMLYRSRQAVEGDSAAVDLQAISGPAARWSDWDWQIVWFGMAARARGVLKAEPFKFLNLGLLAYIGGSEAVAQVRVDHFDAAAYFMF